MPSMQDELMYAGRSDILSECTLNQNIFWKEVQQMHAGNRLIHEKIYSYQKRIIARLHTEKSYSKEVPNDEMPYSWKSVAQKKQ